MEETIPIRIGGTETGALTVRREGAYTVFRARCADPGRLVRLSVYGGGREGYLGVMEPSDGALTLCRRRSRAELSGFPDPIRYAGEAGAAPESPPPPPAPAERSRGRETEVLWYRVGDGSLYTNINGQPYRAIPAADRGLPAGIPAERRVIEGTEYAVFPLKNGRIE